MAEFCEQCAAEMYPPEYRLVQGDFIGMTSIGDQMAGKFAVVLCEGCGPIQVDWRGRCVSGCEADRYHGEHISPFGDD